MGLISSLGKRPSRLHSSMMGMRLSSMNLRVLSRTSRSSSLSSASNSMKSTPLNLMAMSSLSGGRFAGGTISEGSRRRRARSNHRVSVFWADPQPNELVPPLDFKPLVSAAIQFPERPPPKNLSSTNEQRGESAQATHSKQLVLDVGLLSLIIKIITL